MESYAGAVRERLRCAKQFEPRIGAFRHGQRAWRGQRLTPDDLRDFNPAQVHGRASLPWAERIELDVWYVDHRSPRVDLEILLRTPLALFRGTYRGATGGWR